MLIMGFKSIILLKTPFRAKRLCGNDFTAIAAAIPKIPRRSRPRSPRYREDRGRDPLDTAIIAEFVSEFCENRGKIPQLSPQPRNIAKCGCNSTTFAERCFQVLISIRGRLKNLICTSKASTCCSR